LGIAPTLSGSPSRSSAPRRKTSCRTSPRTLLEKRDYLTAIPGKAYFFTAVRNTALRRLLYAWSRYVVAMDPGDLVIAEQMMARGMTSQNAVRLPEPDSH
jgi:hypothetical protein